MLGCCSYDGQAEELSADDIRKPHFIAPSIATFLEAVVEDAPSSE